MDHAITGMHHVAAVARDAQRKLDFYAGLLGLQLVKHTVNYDDPEVCHFYFGVPGRRDSFLELVCAPGGLKGLRGSGTFHHVALATKNPASQREISQEILEAGFNVTAVQDRKYFSSFYFREPGGVLLEIATLGPGFTVDEPPDGLGGKLMLPEILEPRRAALPNKLPYVKWNDGSHT